MGETAWYVLHSKPRREAQVATYLEAHGVDVFYPVARVKPVNPRAAKLRPYFPGYLFAHADLEVIGTSVLRWTPGTTGLVQFGGEPAAVPDHFIYELERRIVEIDAAGGPNLRGMKRGDVVEISSGPFAGHEAIFDLLLTDHERVQLFVEWLGRKIKLTVNANAIEKKRLG